MKPSPPSRRISPGHSFPSLPFPFPSGYREGRTPPPQAPNHHRPPCPYPSLPFPFPVLVLKSFPFPDRFSSTVLCARSIFLPIYHHIILYIYNYKNENIYAYVYCSNLFGRCASSISTDNPQLTHKLYHDQRCHFI